MFRNRQHAGALLAGRIAQALGNVKDFARSSIVVVALPRGGVPVALEMANSLGSSLDVLASKKIPAPEQPELAIGAVTSDGIVVLNQEIAAYFEVLQSYLEDAKRYLAGRTKALEEFWRQAAGLTEPLQVRGKLVILVDDGIATGMTVLAAVRSLKARGVGQIIVATPVISASALALLEKECEYIVTLLVPPEFAAVGQFYLDFTQVEDDTVIDCLRQNQMSLATA